MLRTRPWKDTILVPGRRRMCFLDRTSLKEQNYLEISVVPYEVRRFDTWDGTPYFMVAGSSGTIFVCQLLDLKVVSHIDAHSRAIQSLQYSEQYDRLISASEDGNIKIWGDWKTNDRLSKILKGHTQPVLSIKTEKTGHFLWSASNDKSIKYWDIVLGKAIHTFYDHSGSVKDVQYHEGLSCVTSASLDGTSKIFDAREKSCVGSVKCGVSLRSARCLQGLDVVAVGGDSNGNMILYDLKMMKVMITSQIHSETIWAILHLYGLENERGLPMIATGSSSGVMKVHSTDGINITEESSYGEKNAASRNYSPHEAISIPAIYALECMTLPSYKTRKSKQTLQDEEDRKEFLIGEKWIEMCPQEMFFVVKLEKEILLPKILVLLHIQT